MDEDDFNLDAFVSNEQQYGDDITGLFDEDDYQDSDEGDRW